MIDLSFRTANSGDVNGCANVFVDVFNSAPWNESWNVDDSLKRLQYLYGLKSSIGFICLHKDKIVGFLIALSEPWIKGNMFIVREFCVATKFQRQGIGTNLINTLEKFVIESGGGIIELSTKSDSSACVFYKKLLYEQENGLTILQKILVP